MNKLCEVCALPLTYRSRRDAEGRKRYCSVACRLKGAMALMQLGCAEAREKKSDENYKICKRCQETYPKTRDFFSFGKTKGRITVSSYCRACHSIITTENAVKRYGSLYGRHLKQRYGITNEERQRMFVAQNGLCAICRKRKAVVVDHDHTSGKIRGLLCMGCNTAIAIFFEDPEVFDRAKEYIANSLQIICSKSAIQ